MSEQSSGDPWKARLTPAQYRVLRNCGTEPPFTGALLYNKQHGMYTCAACGAPLFSSETKFDSGSGWPSFWDVASAYAVELIRDSSYGMERLEVRCRACGGHLGHLFDDGPAPTGQRYCINSLSLGFEAEGAGADAGDGTVKLGDSSLRIIPD
jgi:peptide-methionine (R)-S-oxide reductase